MVTTETSEEAMCYVYCWSPGDLGPHYSMRALTGKSVFSIYEDIQLVRSEGC
ncbi:rCG26155 [Rattus norvegicus]|uniref:RCG26155 n=1 Tax=Rattus norvegicus TaxID=10116 RepID=A6HNA0_RAT|nr:rCG26155 [Rattus norvegicus]